MGLGWMGGRGRKDNPETRRSRREEAEGRKIRGSAFDCDWVCRIATVPPLRGPTRHKPARREKSGRSGRDDGKTQIQEGGVKPPLPCRLLPRGVFFDRHAVVADAAAFGRGYGYCHV